MNKLKFFFFKRCWLFLSIYTDNTVAFFPNILHCDPYLFCVYACVYASNYNKYLINQWSWFERMVIFWYFIDRIWQDRADRRNSRGSPALCIAVSACWLSTIQVPEGKIIFNTVFVFNKIKHYPFDLTMINNACSYRQILSLDKIINRVLKMALESIDKLTSCVPF